MPEQNTDVAENPRKDAAFDLLERGLKVLAVKGNEKRPDPLLAPNGFKDATDDGIVVGTWYDMKPKANVGVACGAEYGLVVLDIDVKGAHNGVATLAELGIETVTLTADTPSGGYHLYFRHPGKALPATLPGIDIKGGNGGGYVLAPGSTLPNGAYRWRDPEAPIAEFPESLLSKLNGNATKVPVTPKAKAASPVDSIKVKEGERHARLVKLGGAYRAKGLDPDAIEALLWDEATRYFEPPFDRDNPQDRAEIEGVAHWYAGKEAPADVQYPAPLDFKALALQSPPPREWCIDPWLPRRDPVLWAGGGGIGKSLLSQQTATCLALGRTFIGHVAEPRRVLLWNGEDDAAELWRRQLAICTWLGVDLAVLADNLTVVSFARRDMTLATLTFTRLAGTALLAELAESVTRHRADYVILDNVARIYGGNENDRHQVTSFVAMVAEACGDAGLCLIAHPGKATGSEYSGSTAWEGAVRARLYLGAKLPDQEGDEEPGGEVRYLCRRKSNYSERDWLKFEYKDGVLVPAPRLPAVQLGSEYAQDAVLRAVRKLADLGMHGNTSTNSGDYLPKLAKNYSLLDGLSVNQFTTAMRRLVVDGGLTSAVVGNYANRTPKRGLVIPS